MASTSPEFRAFRSRLIESVVETGLAGYGKNRNEVSLIVYGTTYRQGPLRNIYDEDDGSGSLVLVRDVGNVHSQNAIAVISGHGPIGFLPDPVAAILAPLLDSGQLQLEVTHETFDEYEKGKQALIGARIEIRLCPWSDDLRHDL